MELEQRQLSSFDRPPEVGDVILAARHPSTKSIYAGRWDKFVVWCGTLKIYPLLAKQCVVLSVSQDQQGLPLGRPNGYLSSLTCFCGCFIGLIYLNHLL